MTEVTQVNNAVRAYLGPYGRFVRIEHLYDKGVPDWHYTVRGVSGWIESKLVVRSGRPPPHLTREQIMWGEEEVRHGGRWFLLGLREPHTWLLYDVRGARAWYDGHKAAPVIAAEGAFPAREILMAIAPRDRDRGKVFA